MHPCTADVTAGQHYVQIMIDHIYGVWCKPHFRRKGSIKLDERDKHRIKPIASALCEEARNSKSGEEPDPPTKHPITTGVIVVVSLTKCKHTIHGGSGAPPPLKTKGLLRPRRI